MRPQGTAFSASAKNRDSVMSLGSIAHMQYYFARTGLLDGKGGQLARRSSNEKRQGLRDGSVVLRSEGLGDDEEPDALADMDDGLLPDEEDSGMLPPTVSTYRVKAITTQPPPDMMKLRQELERSLSDARRAVENTSDTPDSPWITIGDDDPSTAGNDGHRDPQAWNQIQGMHILDVLTMAISAAKDYYTFHSHPQTLNSIKSEREIKTELYQAMDILKRMANREFRGGVRDAERKGLLQWLDSITDLLGKERANEQRQQELRSQWQWLQGDWSGCERQREALFLSSFDRDQHALPDWVPPENNEQTSFLRAMSSGLRLVQLHNELVNQSRRRFGTITSFYTDLGKPYRCADNLRYWVKAAELRWQARLQIDPMDIVYDRGEDTWIKFDNAILLWSQTVRRELSDEWLQVSSETTKSALDAAGVPPSPKVVDA